MTLTDVAARYLDDEAWIDFEILVIDGRLRSAGILVLSVVDKLWLEKKIPSIVAETIFSSVGFGLDERREIREQIEQAKTH